MKHSDAALISKGAPILSSSYNTLDTDIRPSYLQSQVVSGGIYQLSSGDETTPEAAVQLDTEMEIMNRGGSKSILRPKPRLFRGIRIPVKPSPPASDGTNAHPDRGFKV